MKKIILLLAVVGITFSSCYKDEYTAPDGASAKKAFFATALETVAPSATPQDITVDFTSAFANDVLLSYTLDGTPMQVTVPAGSTSMLLASVDVNTTGMNHTVILNAIASNGDSAAIDIERKKKTILAPYDGVAGIVKFYLTWDGGTTYDLDFRIRRDNSSDTYTNNVDYSAGYSNPEICDFPETEADGTYYVKLKEYSSTTSLNYIIIAVEPDGTNLVFSDALLDNLGYHYVMEFTKTTDAGTGVISYTYEMYP